MYACLHVEYVNVSFLEPEAFETIDVRLDESAEPADKSSAPEASVTAGTKFFYQIYSACKIIAILWSSSSYVFNQPIES